MFSVMREKAEDMLFDDKKKGDEETRAWREGAQLFVAPTFGGLTLQGRF